MSTKEQQKTRLEILEETVAYYTEDVSRRSRDARGLCRYETVDGKHCAVGRCMIPGSMLDVSVQTRARYKAKYSMLTAGSSVSFITNLQAVLRPEYRGHGSPFWRCLQRLHDLSKLWTDDGLSELGHKRVQQLRRRYQNKQDRDMRAKKIRSKRSKSSPEAG